MTPLPISPLWIAVATLTVCMLGLLVSPLVSRRRAAVDRSEFDLSVYRDQLAEVDREVQRGVVSTADAEAARTEIGRRVLAAARTGDRAATPPAGPPSGGRSIGLALGLVLGVPAAAVGLYLGLGSPELPGRPLAARDRDAEVAESEAVSPEILRAVAGLADRLAENPDDVDGWRLLAQSYRRIGRFDDSVDAWARVVALTDGDPASQSAYAEALVAAAGGRVTEAARTAFTGVLEAAPQDPRARFFLALAEAQDGAYQAALERFAGLLADSPANAPWVELVRGRIADMARELGVDVASVMPDTLPADASLPGPTAEEMAAAEDMSPEARDQMVRGMVEGLAQRLEEDPSDSDGWLRLARAYRVLDEPAHRMAALDRARAAAPDRPEVLVAYALGLYETSEDTGPGRPLPAPVAAMFQRVLEVASDHPEALWFLGLDAANRADGAAATDYWQRLLRQLPPGSPAHQQVADRLEALP